MRVKMALAAVTGALLATGPGPAQLAQAGAGAVVVDVPCSVGALAAAITGASGGETLSLTPGCRYRLAKALPVVSQDLSILGHGATLERSHARGTPAFTILTAESGNVTVSMLNFTNGGGAIFVGHEAALTVDGGTFTGNTAKDGGAIEDQSADGAQINSATFTANTATEFGGAIDFSGEEDGGVQGSVFIGNKAVRSGGAIAGGSPGVSDSTFIHNTAEQGGALYLNAGVEPPVLSHLVVRGNTASGDGGGIFTFALDITGSQITGNHSGGKGGGLFNVGFDYVLVRDTDFRGNSARDGGGLYNGPSFGNLELTGSTVSGNHASANGGGIYNELSEPLGSEVYLDNSTVSGNVAGAYGGGIYNQSDVDADHTRIVRNTAAKAGGGIYDDVSPATATLTNSLVLANNPSNCDPPGSVTGCRSTLAVGPG